jgi:hypothetical protein
MAVKGPCVGEGDGEAPQAPHLRRGDIGAWRRGDGV